MSSLPFHDADIGTPAASPRALSRRLRRALLRLWTAIQTSQEIRARRIFEDHPWLLQGEGRTAPDATSRRDQTWNAVLHGTTCEAGLRAEARPAPDFHRL